MEYTAQSIIVSRNKDRRKGATEDYPYFVMVKMFGINDPHNTPEVPSEILEFRNVKDVIFRNHDVKYMPLGSDIVINDLGTVKVRKVNGEVIIE